MSFNVLFSKSVTRILLVFVWLLATDVQAQEAFQQYYPKEFIQQLKQRRLKDQDLKENLHKIVSLAHVRIKDMNDVLVPTCQSVPEGAHCFAHQSLGYDRARKVMFADIYMKQEQGRFAVTDVYCEKTYTDEDFGGKPSIGPNVLPDGKILNTEHTWPQSRFTGRFPKDTQKSDLHHLYPTDSRMNSSRSSLRFGDVHEEVEGLNCQTARLGHEGVSGEIVFEPPPRHKGNVARSIFYFAVRYQMKMAPREEETLKRWNREDPVDEAERLKNDQILKAQGNRNPFIDFPELIDDISAF